MQTNAALPPGRYALAFDLPDAMLNFANRHPDWTQRLVELVNSRASAELKVLGGGVVYWTVEGTNVQRRVFQIMVEVKDPYANVGPAGIRPMVVVSMPLAVIVTSVAAVFITVTVTLLEFRKIEFKESKPGQREEDRKGRQALAWNIWGVAAVGMAAWLITREVT